MSIELYSQFLFDLCVSRDRHRETLYASSSPDYHLDLISDDLNEIHDLFRRTDGLDTFLKNPFIEREIKEIFLIGVLSRRVSYYSLEFLLWLVDQGTIDSLNRIIKKFLIKVDYKKSIVTAIVTTAFIPISLNKQATEFLRQKLKELCGVKWVRIVSKRNFELIGGFTIEIGSKFIDTSLSTKLAKIDKLLSDLVM